MNKGKVKNYVLDENGNYHEVDNSEEDLEKIYYINPEDLPNEIKKALKNNPFLLTHNPNIKAEIESVEEFYETINEEQKPLSYIIRDDSFSKKHKKRFLKKQFRKWKKEAFNNLKGLIEETKNRFLNTHSERYKKINSNQIFYLIFSLSLSLLYMFGVFKFIEDNKIDNIIGISTIILSIICLTFTFLQKFKISKFDTELINHFNEYERYYKISKRKISKNYKKMIKYYSKSYLNNHFGKDPYPIKNIYIDMKTFERIQANNKDIIKIYNNILKENTGFNIYYHIPLILSYLLVTLNGGYVIIMILIHIYKLIFMKGE